MGRRGIAVVATASAVGGVGAHVGLAPRHHGVAIVVARVAHAPSGDTLPVGAGIVAAAAVGRIEVGVDAHGAALGRVILVLFPVIVPSLLS